MTKTCPISRILVLAIAAACQMTSSASAALIAYEGFDIADGPDALAGASGATSFGFSGAWSAAPLNAVEAPGLSYGALETVGGNAFLDQGVGYYGPGSLRELTTVRTGNIWVSLVASSLNPTSGFGGLTLLPDISQTNGAFALGNQFGDANFSIWGDFLVSPSAGPARSSGVAATTVGFLVANLDLAAGTGTWYVNPTGLGAGLAPSGSDYTGSFTFNSFSLGAIGLRGNTDFQADEIRIGDTWSDVSPSVVPEPSSAFLLIIGTLALVVALRICNKRCQE